jgi:hypothetical protein
MTPGSRWRKSSHSFSNSNCVEVAWAKSSRSGGGNCVEAGPCACGGQIILVRDSKDPGGGTLAFAPQAWAEFTAAVKTGRWRTS